MREERCSGITGGEYPDIESIFDLWCIEARRSWELVFGDICSGRLWETEEEADEKRA